MIEIENFLHENICKYLIDFFHENEAQSHFFNKRKYMPLMEIDTKDPVIKNIINLYKKIKPTKILNNIELVYWPPGESHDWHDDTVYYDFTTITYLNDNYTGGETTVEKYKVISKTGKILIFSSDKLHKVDLLEKGKRYVIVAWYKNG
tara:strand:+ start:53 stop:496 length:444 start_codon:yes stop_codon:yes gene_type:complete